MQNPQNKCILKSKKSVEIIYENLNQTTSAKFGLQHSLGFRGRGRVCRIFLCCHVIRRCCQNALCQILFG